MNKVFTKNIGYLVLINLLIKPFYALGIDTTVQNRVGPEEYGLFLALFNFVYIQQLFGDLGLQNYNNRRIARNPGELPFIFPKVLGAKILFLVLFALIVCLTSLIFGYQAYLGNYLLWILATQMALSLLLYLRTNISGSGKYFMDSSISVLDKLVLIGILVYLLWINDPKSGFQLIHFLWAQFASISFTAIVVFFYINRKLVRLRVKFDWEFTKRLIKDSLPYATLILLMAGYSRLDGIMLERLLDDNALEAGKYASAFRLYDTFNNFSFLFAVLLLPMFSKMIKNNEDLNQLEKWALSLLSLGAIAAISFVIFEGSAILDVFYTRTIDESYSSSFLLLMLATLPLSLNYIYGTMLTANGSMRVLNQIAIFGFILNLVLNWIVIPKYGARGAALTTLTTQSLIMLLQIFYAYRIFVLQISWKLISKLIGVSALSMIIGWGIFVKTEMPILFGLCIYLFLILIMAFLLKLIKREDLNRILSKE